MFHNVLAPRSSRDSPDRSESDRPEPPAHLKTYRVLADKHSLAWWGFKYLAAEVYGVQSENTLRAKTRDLLTFTEWYVSINGNGEIADWLPRDTNGFLGHLEQLGRAPSTINRAFATIRRFARWTLEQKDSPLRHGLPTRGIKELAVDEAPAKKLSRRELHRLFKAADTLVGTEKRKDARPMRNRAILLTLYYTGLRVGELIHLDLDQLKEKHLVNIRRKGNSRTPKLYLNAECRRALDAYLEHERHRDAGDDNRPPLFLSTRAPGRLTRQQVGRILTHISKEASKHREDDLRIHPHQLRHTFGAEYRAKSGSDTETAAILGHAGLKYVGRYVRMTDSEREEIFESLGKE